ncbi:MAG: hypothetical protein KF893_24865 [Caldilineaceae bacterium]|nr:hypothetical protein [Caldilineaceae bacterium]
MQFVRVYTGEDGETHFEDLQIQFQEVVFAPPVLLTPFTPATQWAFFSLYPGWYGDWHPTPRRQIFFYLSGEAEAEVSGRNGPALPNGRRHYRRGHLGERTPQPRRGRPATPPGRRTHA